MVQKIQGSQKDFSAGEVDVTLKRADDNPLHKAGCRQLSNFRILSSGAVKNRPGRTARFTAAVGRTEEVEMVGGTVFYLAFGAGTLDVFNSAGAQVFTQSGFPWALNTVQSIVWAFYRNSFYIAFPGMQPQVLSWDGVATWSVTAFAEQLNNNQKRTFFYRISPQGVTMLPSATGPGAITVTFSSPILVAGMVGTRMRFCNRQILITSLINSSEANATVEEILPNSESFSFAVLPTTLFNVGDQVIGSTSGATGVATIVNSGGMTVQLLPDATGALTPGFVTGETVVGPSGSAAIVGAINILAPTAVTVWDDEVMNAFRGYPSSIFVDQNRLGLCNFPSVPNGIGWSAIANMTDLYVGANPDNAMFELAPVQSIVLFVVAGQQSSEFVFCDNGIYYIPISATNPLVPGSVAFTLLTKDGSANVQPRVLQDVILFMNAGLSSVMAILAPGAFARPYEVQNLTLYHSHLVKTPTVIAAPDTTSQFDERYVYVLNSDGSIAVGSYQMQNGNIKGNIGWAPYTGAGVTSWISALKSDVIFTTSYFGVATIVEALDNTQYLDCALPVNAAPTAFAPPGGKGPLWFIPSQSVYLLDLVTRQMGTYQIDANGNIIPQFIGGENLLSSQLVAGQPWTATLEPFVPDANSGTDVGQRMFKRRVARLAVYVINSTGFLMARLFSGPLTRTSPSLGTIMNSYRVTTYNMDDDPTKAAPQREEVKRSRPIGRSFDPRVAIIKDTPGPLIIAELGIEATI
jgi:hypothetical protein